MGALGDLVLAIPALRAARRAAGPRARLELFAGRERGALLVKGGAAHAAFDGGRADLAPLFAEGGTPPAWLAERVRGALAVLFFREPAPLARNLERAGARVLAVPPRPFEGVRVHCADWMVDRLRHAFAEHGNAPSPPEPLPPKERFSRPRLFLRAPARSAARARLDALGLGPRVLAIHPGSGGARKRWPAERFFEAARAAREAFGLDPLFFLGPVEAEADPGLAAAVRRAGWPAIEAPPLFELAASIAVAAAYLGNDSGPTHLAAALGTPTVALFGPSDPRLFGPRGRKVEILRAGERLADLAVEAVTDALRRAILGTGSHASAAAKGVPRGPFGRMDPA